MGNSIFMCRYFCCCFQLQRIWDMDLLWMLRQPRKNTSLPALTHEYINEDIWFLAWAWSLVAAIVLACSRVLANGFLLCIFALRPAACFATCSHVIASGNAFHFAKRKKKRKERAGVETPNQPLQQVDLAVRDNNHTYVQGTLHLQHLHSYFQGCTMLPYIWSSSRFISTLY